MKKPLLLTFAIFLTSCGLQTQNKTSLIIPEETKKYVAKFEQLHNQPIKDLEIFFIDIDNTNPKSPLAGVAAYCTWKSIIHKKGFYTVVQNTPQVFIDKDTWSFLESNLKREALIFHELGHCIQDKEHDESLTSKGIPNSIMYPIILSTQTYESNYSHYIAQLFNLPQTYSATFDYNYYNTRGTTLASMIAQSHENHALELKNCVHHSKTIIVDDHSLSNEQNTHLDNEDMEE